jgi:NACHT domain
MFERSSQFRISGGRFTSVAGDVNNYNITEDESGQFSFFFRLPLSYNCPLLPIGFKTLFEAIMPAAMHDSGERFHPNCHPGTRKDILTVLESWINHPNPSSSIFWLSGSLGMGKSAIMQAIADKFCSHNGSISATFFCAKGQTNDGQALVVFPTIAFQLSINIPGLRDHINRIVSAEPGLPSKSIEVQLQKLIVEPLRTLNNGSSRVFTVIIDGLDEWGDHRVQQDIVRVIGNALVEGQVPLRFLISSRPEVHLRESFRSPLISQITRHVSLEECNADEDIEVFLREGFTAIFKRNTHLFSGHDQNQPWPDESLIWCLRQKAHGQFMYAATVVKFVDSPNTNPKAQLQVLADQGPVQRGLSDLDDLYMRILSACPDPRRLARILGIMYWSFESQPLREIEDLLGLDDGAGWLIVKGTTSVIAGLESSGGKLHFMHKSFYEFLEDKSRSGQYCPRTFVAGFRFIFMASSMLAKRAVVPSRYGVVSVP